MMRLNSFRINVDTNLKFTLVAERSKNTSAEGSLCSACASHKEDARAGKWRKNKYLRFFRLDSSYLYKSNRGTQIVTEFEGGA